LACSRSVPADTLTSPLLLKLPTQLLDASWKVCSPAAVLLMVPALSSSGKAPASIEKGVALLLLMLMTPVAVLRSVGTRLVAPV
jgi:hypothetical protein